MQGEAVTSPYAMGYEEADAILVEHVKSFLVSHEEVTALIVPLRGTLLANMKSEDFCIGIQRRLHPVTITGGGHPASI